MPRWQPSTRCSPLSQSEIDLLEAQAGTTLPPRLRAFYVQANGMMLFLNRGAGSTSIHGLRKAGDIRAQPFELPMANRYGRPPNAAPDAVFFGSYSFDGSRVFMPGAGDESVVLCDQSDAKAVRHRWSSLEAFLLSEVARMSARFDDAGRDRLPDQPNLPHVLR